MSANNKIRNWIYLSFPKLSFIGFFHISYVEFNNQTKYYDFQADTISKRTKGNDSTYIKNKAVKIPLVLIVPILSFFSERWNVKFNKHSTYNKTYS